MALNLPFNIKPVNPTANLDERYGNHATIQDALDATAGTRAIGLTVLVNGVEYWFRDGISDGDLRIKLPAVLAPQGNWNASTNTPDISATTETGYYWIVSVTGATNIGGITDWVVNDWVVKTAAGWAKIDNTDKVTSVAGKNGVVTLDSADITDFNTEVSAIITTDVDKAFIDALNVDADTLDGLNSLDFVRTTGNISETITGSKTFILNPIIPNATLHNHPVSLGQLSEQLPNILQIGDEFYFDEINTLRLNISTYRQVEIFLTGGSQTITLDFEPTFIYSVSVNGLPLIQNDFIYTSPDEIEILGTLEDGDTIEMIYDFFINPPIEPM